MYKASCYDSQDFYIGKTKRRLYDRKIEHVKAITSICNASADHVTSTGHNLKWDHFDVLVKRRIDKGDSTIKGIGTHPKGYCSSLSSFISHF